MGPVVGNCTSGPGGGETVLVGPVVGNCTSGPGGGELY